MNTDIETNINQIQAVFPDNIETIDIDEKGEDFLVIEINHDWIFGFPRNEYATQTLPVQIKLLPRLAQTSPLPIPEPIIVGSEFFGYRKIKGVLLTVELFNTLSFETRRAIARQIGSFLSALHMFPISQARALGVTGSWGGWRAHAAQRFEREVTPSLSVEARKNVSRFLDEFSSMKYKAVLVHGDFYPPDHVFFDEKTQQLCGVIDFGDVTVEDAATDFKSIYIDFGLEFYQQVLSNYSGDVVDRLIDRIRLHTKANPIFDAVFALEYNQPERFKLAIKNIETHFGVPAS